MKKITVFDTNIASDNLGDGIIMDAVLKGLRDIYKSENFTHAPTHIKMSATDRENIKGSDVAFVGGTNLLCANWMLNPQWKIGFLDAFSLPETVLMGVGWKFYQRPTDFITAFFLRKLLSKKYNHSVRDSYTEARLRKIGINNVINTGCPTMWDLTPEFCASIPTTKAPEVLTTVTAYRHDPELDKKWLKLLVDNYEKIYLWPQMHEDAQYVLDMNLGDKIEILGETLAAYNECLASKNVDYLGTRLHGGIRAMQHKRRSLIIEVDNRATEIARDTRLPTVKRDDVETMMRWIVGTTPTILTLPWDKIKLWKDQFCPKL